MADARTAILITCDDAHEGGFQNMHNDRANWTGGQVGSGTLVGTKYGITCLDLPGVNIQNLTLDQAVAYYTSTYWKPHYNEIANQLIANKLFDLGVLFGIGTAVKALQSVLKLVQDGAFGPTTVAEVNNSEDTSLLLAFRTAMVQHALSVGAANPAERPFVADWIRRINGN